MRFIIISMILLRISAFAEESASLTHLIQEGSKIASSGSFEELNQIFPQSSQRPWSEYRAAIETVEKRPSLEQAMLSSFVAYSPHLEKALSTFRNNKSAQIRICVLNAAAESYRLRKKELPAEDIKGWRELTFSKDGLIAARAFMCLSAVADLDEQENEGIRREIYNKLTKIKNPDQLVKDLTELLRQDIPNKKPD